jgi:hypothetical protein
MYSLGLRGTSNYFLLSLKITNENFPLPPIILQDALSVTDCVAWNDRIIGKEIGKDSEGIGRGVIEIVSRNLKTL